MKHTKGEWCIDKDTWIDDYWAISSPEWGAFALVVTEFESAENEADAYLSEQGKANAQLIVTAPEMLKCLIDDCIQDYNKQIDNPMIRNTKYKYKEVIEKATGMTIEEVIKSKDTSKKDITFTCPFCKHKVITEYSPLYCYPRVVSCGYCKNRFDICKIKGKENNFEK